MSENLPGQHLRTNYVFVDTQAFRKAQFDWTGRLLSKLTEFAKETNLQLLITDITKGEVKSQLREGLNDAVASLKKHNVVLQQVGAGAIVEAASGDAAFAALESAFEKFLKDTRAIDVPITADLRGIFDDYFNHRPPFSEKKKSEFPDAVVISSLLAWCNSRKATAYIVSGDPDLKACCSEAGPLFYAESVGDIISQATVSKDLHTALEKALCDNERLGDLLTEQIKEMEIKGSRSIVSHRGNIANFSGKIYGIDDISIHYVNVLEQEDKTFTCEIELEALLCLDLDIETEGEYRGYGDEYDYDPPAHYNMSQSVWHIFSAEVIAVFDQNDSQAMEIESVYVHGNTVDIRPDQITDRWR